MSTVPANRSDGRSLNYQFMNIHVPLEVLVSNNPNDTTDAPGWAGVTGTYFGGFPYQGDDCGDYRVIPVAGRRNHAFQIKSNQTASYSVQLKGSLDGQNFVSVGAPVTTDGITQVTSGLYKFLQFAVTMTLSGGYDPTQPYGLYITYMGSAD